MEGRRSNYPIGDYPDRLHNKVYLLKHFENYMISRLRAEQAYTYEDTNLTTGMVFVSRYLRMRHVIVFRLSNDLLQVSTRPPPAPRYSWLTYSSTSTTT